MTSGTVPFKEGTVPCLQPQGGFLREQEGFCTLQKQPGENTVVVCHKMVESCEEAVMNLAVSLRTALTARDARSLTEQCARKLHIH